MAGADLIAPWAIWKPYLNNGQGRGSYPYSASKSTKIVLSVTQWKEPQTSNSYPPHFTIDVGPEGRAWQHVDLYHPAYTLLGGLGTGGKLVDANVDAGRTIQIAVIAPELFTPQYRDKCSPWWTVARLSRLAWYLGWICTNADVDPAGRYQRVPPVAPFPFAAYPSLPDKARQSISWAEYEAASGIMGEMNCPLDVGQWGPGDLDASLLLKQVKVWNTLSIPESVTVPGTVIGDSLVEEDDSASSGEESVTQETSMEGKAFKFNPPLHNHNIPRRVDFVSNDAAITKYYKNEPGDLPLGAAGVQAQTKMRIGRIIQHELAAGLAAQNPYRYGFRFLYNPSSVSVSATRNDSVVLNPSSVTDAIVSGINQNFQVVAFTLLLNRQPDVLANPVAATDYVPNITAEDLAGLRKYGTHWDLQTLYLVCNGEWDLDDRGRTSDIGLIVPSSARLILGQLNLFGFVESINYRDLKFSKNMVPMLTEVEIVYRRHVDIQDLAAFGDLVGAISPADVDDSGGGSDGSVDITRTGAADNSPGNSKEAPCPGHTSITNYFGKADHYGKSGKGPHTGDDYPAPSGSQVLATRGGVVVHVGYGNGSPAWGSAYGEHIVIERGNVRHGYCHLSKSLVKKGQTVLQGDKIGLVGSTGNTNGAHLHYEERDRPFDYGNARKPLWGAGVRKK